MAGGGGGEGGSSCLRHYDAMRTKIDMTHPLQGNAVSPTLPKTRCNAFRGKFRIPKNI